MKRRDASDDGESGNQKLRGQAVCEFREGNFEMQD